MRFLFPFLILGLVFLVGGAYSNSLEAVKADELVNLPSNRINSGVPVFPGEFPSVIAIFWYGSFRCSGTLIGPYHVLTSAFCLASIFSADPVSQLKVRIVNTVSLDLGGMCGVEASVRSFIYHKEFRFDTNDNDIAIVVLNSPITNSAFYAKLPTVFNSYANQLAIVAGWGSTPPVISKILMKANVTIQDNTICLKQYPNQFAVGNQLCAFAQGKDICQVGQEFGGPIFVNGVQVGIASYGKDCSDLSYSRIYTRLTTYLTWIKTTVTSNPGPASG